MDITPPYGFGAIVALANEHRLKFQRAVPTFFRTAQIVPVSAGEFEMAGRDMPVAFALGGKTPSFLPVGVCGFSEGQNLFVEGDRWADGVYAPAYLRRWPFCMAAIRDEQGVEHQRLACVDTSVLADDGEPVADAAGRPTALWREYEPLVLEYERDLARTEQLCKLLADFKLFEGFTFDANVPDAPAVQLAGLHRISEIALKALPADQLRLLIDRGAMRLIYAHLASLDRAGFLLQRYAARHRRAAA